MLDMAKKSRVIMLTVVKTDETKLKIKYIQCYFSMLKNAFLTSLGYYLKDLIW